jgi:hypothetical protein
MSIVGSVVGLVKLVAVVELIDLVPIRVTSVLDFSLDKILWRLNNFNSYLLLAWLNTSGSTSQSLFLK